MSTPAVKESFTTADLAIVPPPQASRGVDRSPTRLCEDPRAVLPALARGRSDTRCARSAVLRGQEGGVSMSTQRCTECGGRGIVYIDDCRWYTCPECGGSGYVTPDDEEVEE